MKKYSNTFIIICSFIMLLLILINKTLISNTIILSLYIWFNTLVPSMFPMFVLSDILINYHFTDYIPNKIIKFIGRIFNISDNAVLVFLLSLISGFPTNGINIKLSYDNKLISKEECEHLLYFNHFANPLFILQTIGIFYLKNNLYGYIILISHLLGSFIIGIFFRKNNHHNNNNYIPKYNESQSFSSTLSKAISKSINTLLFVAGTVTLFLILSTLICHIFNINGISSALIKGILEMTMGLSEIQKLNILDIYKVVLSTIFISFGGLSIHLQVISILDEKIKYKNYFIGRILHALISGIISLIIMLFII